MIFLPLKIPFICLNKSTLCQSTLKSKDLCQKESQWPFLFLAQKQQDYAIIRTYFKQD